MDTDEADIKLAIGWNKITLELVGVWPEPTLADDRMSKYKFLISTILIVTFISAPQCINLFLLNGNLELITENLSLANLPATSAALKIIFAWYRREDLKPLVKSFYNDWHGAKTEEERTTMLNSARVSRYLSTRCTVLTQVMVTIYLCIRVVAIVTCDHSKTEQNRLIVYAGYFPYNVRPTLILVLTNVGQVVATYFGTSSYTSLDTFIAMLVLHTCGQFKNLRRRLERLMDMKNDSKSVDQIQEEMVWIVQRHEHLNWMVKKIENSFNVLLLIQMIFCTIEICFQGFMILSVLLHNDEEVLNFTFLFLILFILFTLVHVYLYCYVGEMLLVQSNGMRNSAYNANWFNVAPRKARCLLFIMNRCTRPLCLSAGKFGIFSMELFSAILKTAMGYLSVLLTVSSDD